MSFFPVTDVGTVVSLGSAVIVGTIDGNHADVVVSSIAIEAMLGVSAVLGTGAVLRAGAVPRISALAAVSAGCFIGAIVEEVVLLLTLDSALECWASFSAVDRTVPEEPRAL